MAIYRVNLIKPEVRPGRIRSENRKPKLLWRFMVFDRNLIVTIRLKSIIYYFNIVVNQMFKTGSTPEIAFG